MSILIPPARNAVSSQPELSPLVGLRLLIVADGLERAYGRARGLDAAGYRIATCGEPAEVAADVAAFVPGAVVIDAPAPEDFCRRVRAATAVPVVVAGACGSLAEIARCFAAGADDYCPPGAAAEEVDLRLRAIFRRMAMQTSAPAYDPGPPVQRVGDLEIDAAGQVVRKRGEIVPLSPTEFRLLATLAEHLGRVIPSKALLSRVWGNEYASESHYLRLYVRYLRQKLEDDPRHPRYIVNRWGAGYALEGPHHAA